MEQAYRRHSLFELIVVVALVLVACWPATAFSIAGLLPAFYAVFLICGYLLVRLLVGRLNRWAGKLVFAVTVIVLLADILLLRITGLHLNPFVVSVMLQPGISEELGVAGWLVYGGVLLFLAASLFAASRLKEPSFVLWGRSLAVAGLITGLTAQLLYGVLFFQGTGEIEEVRRKLPFFVAPHPYHSQKILGLFLGERPENPFSTAVSAPPAPAGPAGHQAFAAKKRNILLIVADSLRSKDIKAAPELMPNLLQWAQKGSLNYDHYSVSNCTHFSFYSMFTGALPTDFGIERRRRRVVGMLPRFLANGYALSTAESNPLDWYDTASIIFPAETDRYLSSLDGYLARDKDVTTRTVAKLEGYRNAKKPYFHVAYYFSSHFPYDTVYGSDSDTNFEKYKRTVRAFDDELGKLLKWAEAAQIFDDTLVIITSDHGEEFKATGRTGHASRLSDEQLKVPFILIDRTDATNSKLRENVPDIQGHLDLTPFLLETLDGEQTYSAKPVFLAACGYDSPRGFAVLSGGARVDFSHTDGYLTPIRSPDGSFASKARQLEAAASLLGTIKKGPATRPSH